MLDIVRIEVPAAVVKACIKRFNADLEAVTTAYGIVKNKRGLYPPDTFRLDLNEIVESVKKGESTFDLHLKLRGRSGSDIENAAEEVMQVMRRQDFSVTEAQVFLRYVSDLVNAAPLAK